MTIMWKFRNGGTFPVLVSLRSVFPMLCCALGILLPDASRANQITLTPVSPSIGVGGSIEIILGMSFDDPTQGGGLEITFSPPPDLNSPVSPFASFVFDAGLGDSPSFQVDPLDDSFDMPLEIGFGVLFEPPLVGNLTIGMLTFRAMEPGDFVVEAWPSLLFPGPFFAPGGGAELDVLFGSTVVAVLPEPSTAALLGFGLVGLAGASRGRWSGQARSAADRGR